MAVSGYETGEAFGGDAGFWVDEYNVVPHVDEVLLEVFVEGNSEFPFLLDRILSQLLIHIMIRNLDQLYHLMQ